MNKDYSWVWAILILGAAVYFCDGSASGPEYPNDPQNFNNEYNADAIDTDPRTQNIDECEFTPGACDLDVEPDDAYLEYLYEQEQARSAGRCDIKGNISFETGEKIYHVPGQKYYSQTVIDTSFGERWFCSEEEARAAGWRKSRE